MKKLLYTLFILVSAASIGQEASSYLQEAKALASNTAYTKAIATLENGLQKYPNDHDLLSFRIRILLWNKDFQKANDLLSELFIHYPNDQEGFQLLATVAEWSGDWGQLLTTSELAITSYPDDEGFKLKKLVALKNLERYQEASDFSMTINEKNAKLNALKRDLHYSHHRQLGLLGSYSHFSQTFNPWALGTLRYQHISKSSFNISATYGRMFDQPGTSFNTEYYPKISQNLTGFFELGASGSSIFPQIRAGAELTALVRKIAFSAGGKMLQFKAQEKKVKLLTFGLGGYFGSFYTNYKSYLSKIGDTQSLTHTLLIRRFFKNRFHYLQLNLTNGSTPLQINNFAEISRVGASAIQLSYSELFFDKLLTTVALGGQMEKYQSGSDRVRSTITIGLSRLF